MEGARKQETDPLLESTNGKTVDVEFPSESGSTDVSFDIPVFVDRERVQDQVELDKRDRVEAITKFLKDSEEEMVRIWNHYERFEMISRDASRPPGESEAARVTAEDFLRLFKRQKVLWEAMKEAEGKL